MNSVTRCWSAASGSTSSRRHCTRWSRHSPDGSGTRSAEHSSTRTWSSAAGRRRRVREVGAEPREPGPGVSRSPRSFAEECRPPPHKAQCPEGKNGAEHDAQDSRLIESSVGSRQSRNRAVEHGNEPGQDCSREEKYCQAEGNRRCETKEIPFLRAPSKACKGTQPRGDEDDGQGRRKQIVAVVERVDGEERQADMAGPDEDEDEQNLDFVVAIAHHHEDGKCEKNEHYGVPHEWLEEPNDGLKRSIRVLRRNRLAEGQRIHAPRGRRLCSVDPQSRVV